MRRLSLIAAGLGLLVLPGTALAQDAGGWGNYKPKTFDTRIYGFVDAYTEKVSQTPAGVDDQGNTVWEENPYEFDVLNFNVMGQSTLHGRYKVFFNLASPGSGGSTSDAPLSIRNAWVEAPLAGGYLAFRAGKMYRRFGLYNEILDATPTFIGIEPPEIFDKDHLMVTRTTNLMVFGAVPVGATTLNWSVTTGNDERAAGAIPLGADANIDLGGVLKLGSSFYTTGGAATPSRAVGEGSPRGGVANWMAEDRYQVYGGYAQLNRGGLTVQTEYWQAHHSGTRDEDAVMAMADGGLSEAQMERFFTGGDPTKGVRTQAEYIVRASYIRAGYQIAIGENRSITPYLQTDYFSNPEIVASKSLGGDGEAGLSDDGAFYKYTAGVVLRPVPQVAMKLDGSAHHHQYNGETVFYPEGRVSVSYMWQLQD
ncbi:MAG: hypothetical protein VX899_09560 [Myxococcota bacterium]|nr:hypothetical protein [Myxococcota bacterium]